MLNITKTMDGSALTMVLEGRLDTTTAPQLESELKAALDQADTLVLDFEKLLRRPARAALGPEGHGQKGRHDNPPCQRCHHGNL